ncbi:U1 snRNP complex subunit [Martiniozyma asiatica (nom. inval.)]|nr:U1 snRNP complex subunit [Martiniozyma asiatica]
MSLFELGKPVVQLPPRRGVDTLLITPISDFLAKIDEYDATVTKEGNTTSGSTPITTTTTISSSANTNISKIEGEKLIYDPFKDPLIKGDQHLTIFISRLPFSYTQQELIQTFGKFGAITHSRIVKDRKGNSKGYAFVVFQTRQMAKNAITKANGMVIEKRKIVVDVERGRLVKNWKPMRLGGGLGGRGKTVIVDPANFQYRQQQQQQQQNHFSNYHGKRDITDFRKRKAWDDNDNHSGLEPDRKRKPLGYAGYGGFNNRGASVTTPTGPAANSSSFRYGSSRQTSNYDQNQKYDQNQDSYKFSNNSIPYSPRNFNERNGSRGDFGNRGNGRERGARGFRGSRGGSWNNRGRGRY